MSPSIDVLRHGDTGATGFRGRSEDALSALGWEQMRRAVALGGPWDLILSSPRVRCLAFAREFAAQRGLNCSIDARLAEIDFGAWEGKTHDELLQCDAAALGAFWRDPWRNRPTGGESLPQFATRVFPVFHELAARHSDERVLVVTHGGVMRLLLAVMRGLSLSRLGEIAIPHAALYRLNPGIQRARWEESEDRSGSPGRAFSDRRPG